jgi:hypothetical protein
MIRLLTVLSLLLQNPITMPVLSSDGYVRLTVDHLNHTQMVHFFSALDDDHPEQLTPHVLPSPVSGYTEWVSSGNPTLSIGWDWRMYTQDRQMICELIDTPRSNIMLINAEGQDLGDRETRRLLIQHIASLNWQPAAVSAILQVYVSSSCQN